MSCKVSRVPHFFSYLSHKSIALISFSFFLDRSSPPMSVLHFPNYCPLSEQKTVKTKQQQQIKTSSGEIQSTSKHLPSCRHAALTDRRWSPVSRGIQTRVGGRCTALIFQFPEWFILSLWNEERQMELFSFSNYVTSTASHQTSTKSCTSPLLAQFLQ